MLSLPERIARDRALLAARIADLPRLREERREAKKRGAAIEAEAAKRMAEFRASLPPVRPTPKRRGKKKRKYPNRRSVALPTSRPNVQPSLATRHVKSEAFYGERASVLRAMGFRSYRDYLRSKLWARVRDRVLRLDSWRCRGCGAPAADVHHTAYSAAALYGRDDTHLHSLCRGCHEWVEFVGGVADEANRRAPRDMIRETECVISCGASIERLVELETARLEADFLRRVCREP